MEADLAAATEAEDGAIASFDSLVGAKNKGIEAATAAIEAKSIRLGETDVSIAEMKGDLGDTVDTLKDDKAFLADLDKNCATAQEKYDAIVKERSEEALALADTIKLLNDDDSLELFKKVLPSASSFVQMQVSRAAEQSRALALLKQAHSPRLDFIALALHGKKMGFDKVIAMIDEMVGVLEGEQKDDDAKKDYCDKEFDTSEDKKKELDQAVADDDKAIEDAESTLSSLAAEIKALQDGIKALDKSVAEATEQRQSENAEFKELMSGNTAAVELIGVAKNRLNKFYNPKLYVAPAKRELSEEERIAVNMGETLAPTPAPGGIAGTGITAFVQIKEHRRADPGPAPEQASYSKKTEESNGVIAMMDLLIKDLEKEMQVAETAEKDAQSDYETSMSDAKEKRAADVQLAAEKESATAEAEGALQRHMESKLAANKELMATLEFISGLHGECDWLMQNYDTRKEARAGEVESLDKAKAVLSGADYSLLQQASAHRSLKVRRV